jgi:uncharacterized protein YybS (DUF2232 family)
MTDIEGLKELYLAIGVGGVSFIALIIILGYLLKQVFPILTQIMQMLEVLKEVLQNNNKAIDEMAKSNHNVSTALNLLERSMTNVETKIDEVTDTNSNMEKILIKLDAKK